MSSQGYQSTGTSGYTPPSPKETSEPSSAPAAKNTATSPPSTSTHRRKSKTAKPKGRRLTGSKVKPAKPKATKAAKAKTPKTHDIHLHVGRVETRIRNLEKRMDAIVTHMGSAIGSNVETGETGASISEFGPGSPAKGEGQ